MNKIDKKRIISTSTVLTFMVYLMLILGSSYIFYKSFNHYTNVSQIENYENIIDKITNLDTPKKELFVEEIASKKLEQEILMLNSMIIFLFVVFLIFKRKHLKEAVEEEQENFNIFETGPKAYANTDNVTFPKVEEPLNTLARNNTLVKNENLIDNKKKDIILDNESSGKKCLNELHTLVVEDNPINQKMIQHTLKNIGITSDCADNGQIGLEMYMKNHDKYDMVFMDIQMPVMNGIDATKAILEYEKNNNVKHTPIVAVTANALKGDRENFMSEGMDEYVSKPINLAEFMRVLKMFFREAEDSEKLSTVTKTEKVSRVPKTDILLYKETVTEAKIIAAILNKLDYSVDIVENIDELKKVMDVNSYKCILLDKVTSEAEHSSVTNHIKLKDIPSLLFVDGEAIVAPSDEENFTFISNKITDYQSIKSKVDQLISLAKAS